MRVAGGGCLIRQIMAALAVSLAMLSFAVAARADVVEIALKDLVAQSDRIVVATVTKIEAGPVDIKPWDESFPPVKVATARVVETWKGKADKEVRFVSSPTRPCDIASAKEGEKLVLFLERRKDSPIMMIAHVGRGGMLLHDVKDKPYATLEDEVKLPEGTKTISESKKVSMTLPDPSNEPGKKRPVTFTFTHDVRSIELGTLRVLVRREVEAVKKPVVWERPAPGITP
jgi:hypothetical protein